MKGGKIINKVEGFFFFAKKFNIFDRHSRSDFLVEGSRRVFRMAVDGTCLLAASFICIIINNVVFRNTLLGVYVFFA